MWGTIINGQKTMSEGTFSASWANTAIVRAAKRGTGAAPVSQCTGAPVATVRLAQWPRGGARVPQEGAEPLSQGWLTALLTLLLQERLLRASTETGHSWKGLALFLMQLIELQGYFSDLASAFLFFLRQALQISGFLTNSSCQVWWEEFLHLTETATEQRPAAKIGHTQPEKIFLYLPQEFTGLRSTGFLTVLLLKWNMVHTEMVFTWLS